MTMSKTPICDFVNEYISLNKARLHMPGHKGADFLGFEKFDITEIDGADDLSNPKGIILKSENNASALFDTRHSFFVTGGSSQSIKAMVYMAKLRSKTASNLILAGRNAHKAFLHAVSLLDIQVEWLYPKEADSICSCDINDEDLENALNGLKEKPMAVYITSPDYLGGMCDIKALSAVCNRHGVPLLVDNAHGAYLKFLENDLHPIKLGADMVCDSAHKTLPALTGAAYLHVSKNSDIDFEKNARLALTYFGSSSPSYLILQSLDKLNEILSEDFREGLHGAVIKIDKLKEFLVKKGVSVLNSDPLKLTIDCKKSGYSTQEIEALLQKNGVVLEYIDGRYVVLMLTPFNSNLDYDKIYEAFSDFVKKEEIISLEMKIQKAQQAMSFNNALFSKCETIEVERAKGRICGGYAVACPPAVPVVLSGELILEDSIKWLKQNNVKFIDVIK